MTLHIIKLAVGIDDVAHLAKVQKANTLASGNPRCRTRNAPKQAEELLETGSLYWVIGGYIMVRQKIIKFHTRKRDGKPECLIELDPKHVLVEPTHRRAFQGWRYLKAADAPVDIKKARGKPFVDPKMSKEMQKELRKLGLL
ncbi:MAG: DUF1489 domain-containing protein [Rhodospirillaceae bacterium]|nr:DUF1489 domain-containing protein [Rhodospirillaceae bacterium]